MEKEYASVGRYCDNLNHHGEMAFYIFKIATIQHLGFALRLLGPPTKSTWWS